MSMRRFGMLFPQVAERETRTTKLYGPLPATDGRDLPVAEYLFDELYCDERGCDCRRVMINVLAGQTWEHLATINHAFEKPAKVDPVPEQTFLDPLNRQTSLATALLDLFINVVLADEEYRLRLVRHYRMFKNVVEDVVHPAHRLLQLSEPGAAIARAEGFDLRGGRSITPPPPRRGHRKRWR